MDIKAASPLQAQMEHLCEDGLLPQHRDLREFLQVLCDDEEEVNMSLGLLSSA